VQAHTNRGKPVQTRDIASLAAIRRARVSEFACNCFRNNRLHELLPCGSK
jgi:hypothetical protein